jgi:uncharacterized membrane protein YfcA
MSATGYGSFILFFLITLLAEILGTIGGFGSSLFFVSLAQFFYDFQTVLALTGLLHIFSNTAKLVLFRKTIDWRLVLWLGVSSIALAIVGAYVGRVMSFSYARMILGVFLIVFSTFFFWKPTFKIPATIANSILGGSVAGLLAGFIGTGGAIRGLVLASFTLEKNLFVGTSAAIDFGVDLSRTLIYLDGDYLNRNMWIYIPVLMAASIIGSYLGKLILGKISQERFRVIVLGLILLMGVSLVVGGVKV